MALDNFIGQNIKDTFQRVVQTDGVNFADGTGSIIPIALSTEVSAAVAEVSTSFDVRVTNLKTDSGSFSSRVTTAETNITNLTSDSGSFSTRVTNLKSDSGSFSTRLTALKSNISSSRVTASRLLVTDDTRLDGTIAFNGLQIFEDQLVVRSGSTVFGSGSIPSAVTHQFTGSVFITGSNLTLTDGTVTATSFDGIFKGVISSSAQLSNDFMSGTAFTAAGISGSWQGQSFISGSQVTKNLPLGTISSSNQLPSGIISSSAQIKLNLPTGTISGSGQLPTGIISSSAQIKLNLPAGTISGSNQIKLNLPTGTISGSDQLPDGDFSAVKEDILPDGTRNLGAFDKKWQAIFATDTFFGGIHEINLETKGLDQLQPGTVLVSKAGKMVPCTTEADSLIMGIVSSGHNFPIILGAEPVLVNGPVYEGDYIITSNIIGHGKAVNPSKIFELQLFGKIIAQSLETKTEGGLIRAMIRKM